jgi:hypothetical protein
VGSILGEAYTAYFDGMSPVDPKYNDTVSSEWVITSRLNAAANRNFSSWGEYTGPLHANSDSFTLTVNFWTCI